MSSDDGLSWHGASSWPPSDVSALRSSCCSFFRAAGFAVFLAVFFDAFGFAARFAAAAGRALALGAAAGRAPLPALRAGGGMITSSSSSTSTSASRTAISDGAVSPSARRREAPSRRQSRPLISAFLSEEVDQGASPDEQTARRQAIQQGENAGMGRKGERGWKAEAGMAGWGGKKRDGQDDGGRFKASYRDRASGRWRAGRLHRSQLHPA